MLFNSTLTPKLDSLLEKLTLAEEQAQAPIHGLALGVTDRRKSTYINCAGYSNTTTKKKLTLETPMSMFSLTKSLTCTAILILHERGVIDIEKPAYLYLPKIKEILLIDEDGVDDDGNFIAEPRPSKNPITIRNLLTHTSGIAYPFLSMEYLNLMKKDPTVNAMKPTPEYFTTEKMPLLFEPGTKFAYGHSVDWLGLLIHKVTGTKLSEFLDQNIFSKIGMNHTKFVLEDDQEIFPLHRRTSKGIFVHRSYFMDTKPEVEMGGQGAFLTVPDYLKFLRMWLNYGTSPDTGAKLLNKDTAQWAIKNQLGPGIEVNFDTVESAWSPENSLPLGFSLAGCAINQSPLSTGRPAGSLFWSGLGNLYFWMDFTNGIGGIWATQLFPFLDPEVLSGLHKMESIVYESLEKNKL